MSQSGTASPGTPPAPAAPRAPRSQRVRRLSQRTRRRAIVLGVVTGLLAALLILALDAGLSARRMLSRTTAARNDLISGATSVVTGDPNASVAYFTAAAAAARSAVAAAGHPGIRILGALPWIGENVRAARAVAVASQATAGAGLTMAEAAKTLGWNDLSLPGTTSLRQVDLGAIRSAEPAIASVAAQLNGALSTLNAVGGTHLLGPVARGYNDTLAVLTHRAALANDARNLFGLLPRLLGGSGPRRYLLCVESLAQPQNPGGRVGPVGVMAAVGGHVSLEPLSPADPALADTMVSPNVPLDARALLALAAQQGLPGLDGVILVDTAGLQDLLWMVGDVGVADLSVPLTQNNAVDVLDREVFLGGSPARSAARQASLAGELLDAALRQRPSTEAFGIAMAQMVGGRHLAVYTTDRKAQLLLGRLGASGVLDTTGNFLHVTLSETGTNRTGTFIGRALAVGVTLDDAGTAAMRMVMDLTNDAANAPASVLLGQAFSQNPVGSFSADASVYLPKAADHVTIETSTPGLSGTLTDLGVPVASSALSLSPGGSTSIIVTARVKGAATHQGSGWVYVIRIVPQPTAAPQPLRVLVRLPTGGVVTAASSDLQIAGTLARYVGTPDGAVTLFVRYR